MARNFMAIWNQSTMRHSGRPVRWTAFSNSPAASQRIVTRSCVPMPLATTGFDNHLHGSPGGCGFESAAPLPVVRPHFGPLSLHACTGRARRDLLISISLAEFDELRCPFVRGDRSAPHCREAAFDGRTSKSLRSPRGMWRRWSDNLPPGCRPESCWRTCSAPRRRSGSCRG